MTPFRKMQGLGNDFVVFDARKSAVPMTASQARAIADRHFGVGCDTLVLIETGGGQSDAVLRFFNADGGEVESCGNATRCVARHLMDESGRPTIRLDSKGGPLVCEDAGQGLVRVDLGVPGLDWRDIPVSHEVDTNKFSIPLADGEVSAAAVLMGNPHCILFVDDAGRAPVTEQGPRLETHAFFPNRINVEFAHVKDPGHIRMRVWERGVGVTLACGTGAAATAVAAARRGLTGRKVAVELDGGTLQLEWRQSDDHVLMTGPGVTVFQGELDLDHYGH